VTAEKSALHVLVVDDEPLIRWSVCEVLGELGHEVEEASDGASAMRRLSEGTRFDVIVLDYRLPDSNDLRLLEAIRRLAPESAVIMMTAFGTPEMVAGALALGASRVLPKPFDVHDLACLVAEVSGSQTS
jgi:ATP-dependent Lon protease